MMNARVMTMNGIKQKLFGAFVALVAMTSNVVMATESVTFIHTDHLGSPIAATNEDGVIKWRERYQPFGQQLVNEDTDNRVGFTGHMDDKGLGLTYMQARWYHPEAGRFMATDPIVFRESNLHSFNRYTYANNNPYNYVDPDGENAVLAWCFTGPWGCGAALVITAASFTFTVNGINNELNKPNSTTTLVDQGLVSGDSTTWADDSSGPWSVESPAVSQDPKDLVQYSKKNKKKKKAPNTTPKKFTNELEKIKRGEGEPRLKDDGSQKEWEGRKHKRWKGGKEWNGPDGGKNRIIEKEGKYGWSDDHWETINDFN